jgi:hypothetical protein
VKECTASSTGERIGLPPLAAADSWLPDPNAPLRREYWRVFVRPSGTAYILPDPTLPPQYYISSCATPEDPLFEILMRYSFCEPQGSWDEMTPTDALAVAHAYHQQLAFSFYSPGIVPAPVLSDVIDACELGNADDSPEFGVLCDFARDTCAREDGTTIPNDYWTGQGGADLAYHLNELYGIAAARYTVAIGPEACDLPSDVMLCSSAGPRYFYNPASAVCEVRSFGSCGNDVADFPSADACEGACVRRAHGCERCVGDTCLATDCSTCPITTPTTEGTCNDVGITCTYGSGCSWYFCSCTPVANGTGVWSCVGTAC